MKKREGEPMNTPLIASDTAMSRSGWRDEPLEIEVGGLYEVWFDESAGAQPALAIGPTPFRCFKVLVNGKSETLPQESIFETGTAPPPDILNMSYMYSTFSHQMQEEEDQKILKMLSETMLNK